jgi:protein-tyrosine phosphatase
MREIVPRLLWLGNAIDVRDPRCLLDVGVAAVVDLAYEEPLAALPRDILYCRFPIVDGAGNRPQVLVTAIETTVGLIRRRIATLVGCGAGMSRSPAIVAAALGIIRGDSPDACLQELTAGNPHDVSPTLWTDVKIAYNKLAMPEVRHCERVT